MAVFRLSSLLLASALLTPGSASAAAFVFTGSGVGPIPDSNQAGPADWGRPLDVTFNVSGLSGAVFDVSLSITMAHEAVGDLDVTLIPPPTSGANPFTIFSRVGANLSLTPNLYGSSANLGVTVAGPEPGTTVLNPVTYVFSDNATASLWTAAGFNLNTGNYVWSFQVPAGSYRTSVPGPWDYPGAPSGGNPNAGQPTSFAKDSGFVGLTPQQASGIWTLRFLDGAADDTGFVTDATMTITPVPEPSQYAIVFGLGLLAFAGIRRLRLA